MVLNVYLNCSLTPVFREDYNAGGSNEKSTGIGFVVLAIAISMGVYAAEEYWWHNT